MKEIENSFITDCRNRNIENLKKYNIDEIDFEIENSVILNNLFISKIDDDFKYKIVNTINANCFNNILHTLKYIDYTYDFNKTLTLYKKNHEYDFVRYCKDNNIDWKKIP